jgi:hypothetical protein
MESNTTLLVVSFEVATENVSLGTMEEKRSQPSSLPIATVPGSSVSWVSQRLAPAVN